MTGRPGAGPASATCRAPGTPRRGGWWPWGGAAADRDRVRVVDDGSVSPDGTPLTYDAVRAELFERAAAYGVEATWDRTENRGKRHAQMHVLADDADVFVALDSDSVLDVDAVAEGLKPFADPAVRSVAGQVVVLDHDATPLTRLWTTVAEYLHIVLGPAIPAALLLHPDCRPHLATVAALGLLIGLAMSYLMALRLFTVDRTDMTTRQLVLLFLLAPVAAAWRAVVLRPMYLYAMATCRRINRWGTRGTVDVNLNLQ